MRPTLKTLGIILSVIFVSLINQAKAQSDLAHPFSLGIGGESGFSGGHEDINFNFNVIVRLEREVSRKFAVTLASGIQTYSYIHLDDARPAGSTVPFGPDYNFQMIPVKFGVKYYYVAGAYCDIEAGAGFANRLERGTKLIASPGAGYGFKRWDLSARIESLSTSHESIGMIAINCTYKFGL